MQIRNLRQQNDKTKEKRRNTLGQKEKSNTWKNDNATRGNKPESAGEKVRLKIYQEETENLAMVWIYYKKAYDMIPQS